MWGGAPSCWSVMVSTHRCWRSWGRTKSRSIAKYHSPLSFIEEEWFQNKILRKNTPTRHTLWFHWTRGSGARIDWNPNVAVSSVYAAVQMKMGLVGPENIVHKMFILKVLIQKAISKCYPLFKICFLQLLTRWILNLLYSQYSRNALCTVADGTPVAFEMRRTDVVPLADAACWSATASFTFDDFTYSWSTRSG